MKQFACLLVLFTTLTRVLAGWTPPTNPDPEKILNEAQADAAAGKYEDALAKHIWFHQNALKYESALYGVRLSFALSYWLKLGEAYPPALEKLKSIRDETGEGIRRKTSKDSSQDFHDFESINRELKEESKTKELFFWLDSNQPEVAEKVFKIAEPVLISAKEYKLCGKYVNPDQAFQWAVEHYRGDKRLANDPKFGKRHKEYGEKSFSNRTTTLVALLVINGRKADADRIVGEATKEWDDPKFKKELEKALGGEVPAPWP